MAMDETEEIETLIKSMEDVQLKSLNIGCRRKIAMLIDPEGSLIPDSDKFNDWGGYAELLNFSQLEIENLKRHMSPTQGMLHLWTTRKYPEPTVGNLIRFLYQLQRLDVIKRCRSSIERDVAKWKEKLEQENIQRDVAKWKEKLEQENIPPNPSPLRTPGSVPEVEREHEMYYDCFVIYNPDAPDQLDFVKEMSGILEGPKYNLRLFIPWRDDLVGTAMHSVSAAIIEKKCRRCLVILSKSFNSSHTADFQLKFAHALSPGARLKRLIPIVIEKMEVPNILNFVDPAPFYNVGIRHWQWPRVVATIKSELLPDPETWLPEYDAWNIKLDTTDITKRKLWGVTLATQYYPEEKPVDVPVTDAERKNHKNEKAGSRF